MGFSLNKVISFSVLSLTLGACKLPETNQAQELVMASATEVRNAHLQELAEVDLHQIEPNQYVFYEGNYRAENSSNVVKFLEVERLVRTKETHPDSTKLVMTEALRSFKSSGSVDDEKISDVIWKLDREPFLQSFLFNDLTPSSDEEPPLYDGVQYYNLKVTPKKVPAPYLTKQRPDCGGLTNCEISGTEIYYVAHLMKNGNVARRLQYRTFLSAQVPPIFWDEAGGFLPMVSECVAYLYEGIYLNECVVLRDLKR